MPKYSVILLKFSEDILLLALPAKSGDLQAGINHHVQYTQRGHCATTRKVASSIPDGVIGLFHLHNPSGCAMAMGSIQPQIEMRTRNIF